MLLGILPPYVRTVSIFILPVTEAETIVIGSTSQHEHNAQYDKSYDRDEFDTRKPELGLPEERDGDDVQCKN
jgi:hypothetical protein